jgi:hypothetical protein
MRGPERPQPALSVTDIPSRTLVLEPGAAVRTDSRARRTGHTLPSCVGESRADLVALAELISRMATPSTRAARVYLHAREERDQQLAATLDKMARRELKRSGNDRIASRSGTRVTVTCWRSWPTG